MDRVLREGARLTLDSWRRVPSTDEPIYCPAPSPSGPDDIIYPGSDDETDEAAKLAKRLRYEKCGRNYLQGRPLRIFSASLRGPFDKDSGWQNPWLPKPSSQHEYCPNNSTQRLEPSSAIKYKGDIPVSSLLSNTDDMTADVDDSIRCHLPSPQSHQDNHFVQSSSRLEKHSQIRSWAEHVQEGMFEKDQFWAPNHEPANSDVNIANKRPAGSEWLKRRPVKKRKPDSSQTAGFTSTPTPLAISVSNCDNERDSDVMKAPVNRSFEITPSLSPENGSHELPDTIRSRLPTSNAKGRRPVSSNKSTTSAWMRTVMSSEDRIEGVDRQQGREIGNTGALNDIYQQQSKRRSPHPFDRSRETTDFQDCADESFCYRARPLKQALPPTLSNIMAVDPPCRPKSPKPDNSINVTPKIDFHEPSTNSNRNVSSAKHPKHSRRSTGGSATDKATNIMAATIRPDHSLVKDHELALQSRNVTSPSAATSCFSRSNMERPLRDITPNVNTSSLNTCSTVPHTIFEGKGTHSTSAESFVDEGSTTLVGVVNAEQFRDTQPTKPTPTTKPANASGTPHDGNITKSTEVYDTIKWVASTTLHGVAKPESEANGSPHSSVLGNATHPTIDVAVSENQAQKGSPRIIETNEPIPPKPQSPSPHQGSSIKPGNDIIRQAKDQYTTLSAPSVMPLLRSPARMYHSPTIRPSQQSPWVRDTTESMKNGQAQQCGSDLVGEEKTTPHISGSPYTPIPQVPHSTVDGEVSIRSFSNFNLSSPRSSIVHSGGFLNGSILSSKKTPSAHTSTKSGKRVSFAPLPHEQENSSSQPPAKSRAVSPPPPALVNFEDENIGKRYQAYFRLMNRRLSIHKMPKPQYQQRLLPTFSQQIPASPPVDAMAKVFREADAQHVDCEVDVLQDNEVEEAKEAVEEAEYRPQSPWREESQGVDDVAAVIGHLDEFLDVWDVDTEIDKSRAELDKKDRQGTPPSTDMRVLQGVGIW